MEDVDYALGRTEAEYHRLIEQAAFMRPLTERMLNAAGVCAGMHVLDVGCGVGDVSFLVSSIVGPEGSVIGVDLDGAALEVAEARCAEQGITNVVFREGDAGSIELGRPLDAAVGRFVLMFLADPTAALRRLSGYLRPGGIVAFHEWVARVRSVSADQQPLLASLLDLLVAAFERSGASLNMGAELYWRMLDAGLEPEPTPLAEIAMDMSADTLGPRRWSLFARSMLPKIVDYGLATEPDVGINTLEQRLRDEFRSAGGVMPLTYLMIAQWSRKPTH
jgi:ubiquinone/menaquinone biosynthesis C-methylase UbiE